MGIEYLHIETYKGLVDKKLENLGDVNVLVGDNNTCKTTFLEAINLVQSKNKVGRTYDIAIKRQGVLNNFNYNLMIIESLASFFNVNDKLKTVFIKTSEEVFKMQRVNGNITGEMQDCFTAMINDKELIDIVNGKIFNNETDMIYDKRISESKFLYSSALYNNMNFDSDFSDILLDEKDVVLELINNFDESIIDIAYAVSKHTKLSVLKLRKSDKNWFNLSSYGDGIKKVILFVNTILKIEQGGILLIDEIETSLHFSALESVYTWLVKVCKERDIQLFVTTHSREALSVLTEIGVEDDDIDLVVYKLENYKNDIIIKRVDEYRAMSILEDGGDLR